LLDAVRRDPLSMVTIVGAVCWSVDLGPRNLRPLVFGIVAYVGYVVWSGGDFMAGRMLSTPLVLAVGIVASAGMFGERAPWSAVPAVALLGAMALHSPLGRNALDRGDNLMNNGVADERGFYFGDNGLLNYNRDAVFPGGNGQVNAHQTRDRGILVVEFGQNGLFAFFAGPTVHVIDHLGLGDPLLSRLPAMRPWRPGHYRRELPSGYRETIESGINQINDAAIAAYYERLSLIVRGPMWDRRRLGAIIRMNLGAYDHWLPVAVARPAS